MLGILTKFFLKKFDLYQIYVFFVKDFLTFGSEFDLNVVRFD